jgi:hypothetical protein
MVTITHAGRTRFLAYIDALEAIVRDVQKATSEVPGRTAPAR